MVERIGTMEQLTEDSLEYYRVIDKGQEAVAEFIKEHNDSSEKAYILERMLAFSGGSFVDGGAAFSSLKVHVIYRIMKMVSDDNPSYLQDQMNFWINQPDVTPFFSGFPDVAMEFLTKRDLDETVLDHMTRKRSVIEAVLRWAVPILLHQAQNTNEIYQILFTFFIVSSQEFPGGPIVDLIATRSVMEFFRLLRKLYRDRWESGLADLAFFISNVVQKRILEAAADNELPVLICRTFFMLPDPTVTEQLIVFHRARTNPHYRASMLKALEELHGAEFSQLMASTVFPSGKKKQWYRFHIFQAFLKAIATGEMSASVRGEILTTTNRTSTKPTPDTIKPWEATMLDYMDMLSHAPDAINPAIILQALEPFYDLHFKEEPNPIDQVRLFLDDLYFFQSKDAYTNLELVSFLQIMIIMPYLWSTKEWSPYDSIFPILEEIRLFVEYRKVIHELEKLPSRLPLQ